MRRLFCQLKVSCVADRVLTAHCVCCPTFETCSVLHLCLVIPPNTDCVCLQTANSDIFFDDTLVRLSGRTAEHPVPRLQDTRTVLALLKWRYHADSLGMTLNLRTDSQGKLP